MEDIIKVGSIDDLERVVENYQEGKFLLGGLEVKGKDKENDNSGYHFVVEDNCGRTIGLAAVKHGGSISYSDEAWRRIFKTNAGDKVDVVLCGMSGDEYNLCDIASDPLEEEEDSFDEISHQGHA